MKREATAYEAALRAFRAVTEEPEGGAATRARVLTTADRRGARGLSLRRGSLVAALLLVALTSGSVAWTAVGRWRAEDPQTIEAEATPPSLDVVERRGSGRPVRVIPAAIAVDEPPSSATDGERESAAYARAHRAHFVEDAPARALAAWNAYLASYPAGTFAPEAAYNRGLCLARLARFAEASAALRPFARGRFGAYRREEAARLLDWLAGHAP